jgi:hypothetical protein
MRAHLLYSLKSSMSGEALFLTVMKIEFGWEKLKNVNNQ